MNTQDQFFHAGEKVTRVAYAHVIGLHAPLPMAPETDFGRVLCVESCRKGSDGMNRVTFIGVPRNPEEQVWYACCFRRIEEIQLCVRAAEKFKQNEEVEV